MASTKTAKTPTSIQQAAICRCTDKATHEVFYTMKSDSSDEWYQVRWIGNRWQCNCPATKPCKHERAVNEVLAVRRERIAAKIDEQTAAIVATMQAEEDSRQPAAPASSSVAILVPEGIAVIDKSEVTEHDILAEDETPGLDAAEQHINQLRQQVAASRAILAAPLNNQSHKMEVAPSGRLVPMR